MLLGTPILAFQILNGKWFYMKREDIFVKSRVRSKCLPKAKLFVA